METKSLISFVFLFQAIIMNGDNLSTAQKPNPSQQLFKCSNNGNFKSDDLVKQRDVGFRLLTKNSTTYNGYLTGNGDGLWTMALCPPFIKKEACLECVNNTVPYLKKNCPKQKEGVAWTVLLKVVCIVRYSDSSNLERVAEWAWATFASQPNVTTVANAGELEKGLNYMADKMKRVTAMGTWKYGHGNITYGPGSHTLYASMQCNPETTIDPCIKCLSDATKEIHNCCSKNRQRTGLALSSNCYFWYAHYNFLS